MDGEFRADVWRNEDALLNQRVCRIEVVSDRYDPEFLRLVLPGYLDAIWAETSSVTVKHLSSRSIADIPLPLPPIEEQHRIVAILDEHLARLEAADRQLALAKRRAANLLRATLHKGLRGGLVADDLSEGSARDLTPSAPPFVAGDDERWWPVPSSWTWTRLGHVFEINVGATPPRADATAWSGSLPWVSSGEVAFGRIRSTREHITREAAGNPTTRIHPPGTVMLAMIGEGKTRGQAAILDIEAAHNQNCASIRVADTAVIPEYVYGYLEERYLETRRGGAGGQQPALNKAAIQRFPIPLPPLGTQRKLVSAWMELRDTCQRLASVIDQSTAHSANLRRSILVAAFSGRLTRAVPVDAGFAATGAAPRITRASRDARINLNQVGASAS
jgi:type I restriction enzyme S subunit